MQDDVALMRFAFRFLKQSLFGETTIPERPGALEKRVARRKERTTAASGEAG
jgi:hypothetical protein